MAGGGQISLLDNAFDATLAVSNHATEPGRVLRETRQQRRGRARTLVRRYEVENRVWSDEWNVGAQDNPVARRTHPVGNGPEGVAGPPRHRLLNELRRALQSLVDLVV